MADIGITFDLAAARLQLYLDAEQAVLGGQAFKFADGKEVTMADLQQIRAGVASWSAWVDKLNPAQRVLPTLRPVGRVRAGRYRSR